MDIVTLGAALNGSAEYVNSHFKGGSNIQIVDNPDGTQTINASGEVSAEDTVARAEIAEIKDGETLDSFGDVETALGDKADTSTTYTKTEVDTALDDKVDKVSGKGLSTNDYTTAEKTKLAGIAEGAEVNEIESIKVNNTTINPDANKVVNITVPTTAADVSALPDTTKYAVALSLTINSSTFVMTGQLKDQNGDNLGTAQTIDLPLESVVVGGSYNSQTKKVVLTLQNGNTIEFSVADLVSGLQTELSTSNKLNPAFIEYDSTHRAVSDTEKLAWNSKQNALSSTQLDAVNSGIDSTKVAQIETNKNNISTATAELIELVDSGAKNLFSLDFTCQTVNGVVFTNNNDGTVTVTGTLNAANAPLVIGTVELPAGTYVLSGSPSGGGESSWQLDTTPTYYQDTGSGVTFTLNATTTLSVRIRIAASGTLNLLFKPMVCTKTAWDVSQNFVPYRPTYDETVEQVVKNSTYTATSENGTFRGLLKNAIDYYGITGTVAFSGTVYTNTGFVYFVGLFDYNRAVNIQQVANVNVTYSLSNNQGDVTVTGSSGPYTAMIDIFVAQ